MCRRQRVLFVVVVAGPVEALAVSEGVVGVRAGVAVRAAVLELTVDQRCQVRGHLI